jgi:hypothetical protein
MNKMKQMKQMENRQNETKGNRLKYETGRNRQNKQEDTE